MSTFHKVIVKKINRETADAVSFSLNIPDTLKEKFSYIPGQYLTFKVNVNGEDYNRSYSLCSAPILKEDLTVAVKEVKGGKVSTYLNQQLKEGDEIEVMEPLGNFQADITEDDNQHYILFGGGSGITPLFSILKSALHRSKSTSVSLFYANYNSKSVIFKNELNQLQKQFGNRFKLVHVFDQPEKSGGFLGFGKKISEELDFVEGRMNQKMVIDLLKKHTNVNFSESQFYMCGPGGLMDEVTKALSLLQIPEKRVHREYFTEKSDDAKQTAQVGQQDATFSGEANATIIYDGEEFELTIDDKTNILDAALDKDIDPPFACMVGACTTCRAKLTEGSVHMKDRDALTDKEVEAGYILTCQSYPRSSTIKVNYDE